jgi:hypothetical protein
MTDLPGNMQCAVQLQAHAPIADNLPNGNMAIRLKIG